MVQHFECLAVPLKVCHSASSSYWKFSDSAVFAMPKCPQEFFPHGAVFDIPCCSIRHSLTVSHVGCLVILLEVSPFSHWMLSLILQQMEVVTRVQRFVWLILPWCSMWCASLSHSKFSHSTTCGTPYCAIGNSRIVQHLICLIV